MRSTTEELALLLCLAAAAAPGVSAQADERAFLARAAEELDEHASRCSKSKFHEQARDVWREVISFYAPDHEHARASLGYLRVGTSWAPDPKFRVPAGDEPDAATARVLARQFEATQKELAAGHRELGVAYQAAGDQERARWHFERTLRFAPSDATASAATGRKNFEGLFGNDVELELLRRSRLVDRSVVRLLAQDVPVKAAAATHPLLDRAGVTHVGVETERFLVYGDWDKAVLEDCARHAERSHAFCKELFAGIAGYEWRPRQKFVFLMLQKRETFQTVIRANEDRLGGSDLAFLLENVSATTLEDGATPARVAGFEQAATVNDHAVRQVAVEWGGFRSDALREGIGHAVVGWFFGRNLIFNVAQQKDEGRTSTGTNAQRFNLPDLSIWAELAADLAWDRTDTPAAKLPGISAADFSNADRIKAWSFCDYVLRRDPKLLRVLDSTFTVGRKASESDVAKRFAEGSGGLALDALDGEWRRFWTEDSAILRAIRNKQTPLDAVSKRAPEFLAEFNRLRGSHGAKPVGWSAEYSADCRQHGLYLEANKGERGPQKEHAQDPAKKGGSLGGRMFASRALVATDAGEPGATVEDFAAWPGYRDAVLNPALVTIGLWTEGKLLVMDVSRGIDAGVNQAVWSPRGTSVGASLPSDAGADLVVPNEVASAALGAELEALFAARGKKPGKTIGWPITMHFFRSGSLPRAASIRCTLRLENKDEVPGIVHVAESGASRRSAAPGLVVFYPLAPLKRGARYTVEWDWEGGGMDAPARYQFFTK